ncbi:hypothetical protein PGT21_003926 [Puccinia graminis f. sp. tritici]|uniref:Uncharacterized protein n=1 Tax=Puccinia graminis f. sp. tritici TaxID=56615 RepID=A0A5B0LI06_PUCGR|nr:hypothetical protein PGT21_003926 [Puccinia graminis f. sp. tritici]
MPFHIQDQINFSSFNCVIMKQVSPLICLMLHQESNSNRPYVNSAIFLYASWFILQLLHSNLISSVSVFYLFFPHDWDHCLTSQLMFLVSIVLSPLPTWPT